MNPHQKVRDLAKQAGAVITAEEVDEFAKILLVLEKIIKLKLKNTKMY